MTATIIQRANDILALSREKADDVDVNEILCSAAFVTTLLPLTMAYIIPLATSDPRVSHTDILSDQTILKIYPSTCSCSFCYCFRFQI